MASIGFIFTTTKTSANLSGFVSVKIVLFQETRNRGVASPRPYDGHAVTTPSAPVASAGGANQVVHSRSLDGRRSAYCTYADPRIWPRHGGVARHRMAGSWDRSKVAGRTVRLSARVRRWFPRPDQLRRLVEGNADMLSHASGSAARSLPPAWLSLPNGCAVLLRFEGPGGLRVRV